MKFMIELTCDLRHYVVEAYDEAHEEWLDITEPFNTLAEAKAWASKLKAANTTLECYVE